MTDLITYGDTRYTLDELCDKAGTKPGKGVTVQLIRNRLNKNWGLSDAIARPKVRGRQRPMAYGRKA